MSENKHTPEPMAWMRPDSTTSFISHRKKLANEFQACSLYSIALYDHQDDRVAELTKQRDEARALSKEHFDHLNGWQKACLLAEKQRDDLLAALEKCRKELSAWMRDHGEDIGTREAVSEARAAIASAKSYGHPDKSAENETTIPAIIFYPAGSLGEEVAP